MCSQGSFIHEGPALRSFALGISFCMRMLIFSKCYYISPSISRALAPIACDSHNVMVPKDIIFRIRLLPRFALELASFWKKFIGLWIRLEPYITVPSFTEKVHLTAVATCVGIKGALWCKNQYPFDGFALFCSCTSVSTTLRLDFQMTLHESDIIVKF